MTYLKPKTTNSLPGHYRPSRSRSKRSALSMYSSPQFIPRNSFYDISSYRSPSQSSLCSSYYQQNGISQYNASSVRCENKGLQCFDAKALHDGNCVGFINDRYKLVPVYFDPAVNNAKRIEEEHIYYDCDTCAKNAGNAARMCSRDFDVRSQIIKEESYGEV